jgi:hypothetical protein
MKEHIHAKVIRDYAKGHEIEFRPRSDHTIYGSTTDWYPCKHPDFHPNFEYRVKRGEQKC